MTNDEYFEVIRKMIEHEGEMMNDRMTWLSAFQAFLFIAFSYLWKEPTSWPIYTICVLGLLASVVTWFAINAAGRAIDRLRGKWEQKIKDQITDYPPVIGLPKEENSPARQILFAWNSLPWLIAIAWVFLLVGRLKHDCCH